MSASSFHDLTRRPGEINTELAALKRRRNELVARRTGFATNEGGSNHGPSPGAWVKLGSQALAGDDLSRVNVRISEIQDELVRRLGPKLICADLDPPGDRGVLRRAPAVLR